MRRLFISAICIVMACEAFAAAPLKDTINTNIRAYRDEVGFYQKANRDLGDPRFMFSDPEGKIDFGIGGTAKITTAGGFGGQSEAFSFRPSSISIPTVHAGMYNMSVGGTEVHFKARTYMGEHKMVAFIKLNGDFDKSVSLNQAYISLDNFSVGLIPSFFMDLEVGVMTTGLGFDSQVDMTHPLIGYTWRFKNGLSLAAALEWPELNLDHYPQSLGVGTAYQPVPDFAGHLKYRFEKGHIQFGAVARGMTYWVFNVPVIYEDQGEDRMAFGYGLSFSGNYNPTSRLKLSWELSAGRGYAAYLNNLGDLHLDLGMLHEPLDGYVQMAGIPATSDQIAAQYKWSEKFTSSVVLGYTHCKQEKTIYNADPFKSSFSAIANFFWNINDYSYFGVEYLFGNRRIYVQDGTPSFGLAHRLAVVMAYCF